MAGTIPITLSAAMGEALVAGLNAELSHVAEPIIKAACADLEKQLRQRLGALMISMITRDMSCFMMRDELHIVLHQARRGSQGEEG